MMSRLGAGLDERDDPHLAAAPGADERIGFVHPLDHGRPTGAAGSPEQGVRLPEIRRHRAGHRQQQRIGQ
jgi:hypothetical protein